MCTALLCPPPPSCLLPAHRPWQACAICSMRCQTILLLYVQCKLAEAKRNMEDASDVSHSRPPRHGTGTRFVQIRCDFSLKSNDDTPSRKVDMMPFASALGSAVWSVLGDGGEPSKETTAGFGLLFSCALLLAIECALHPPTVRVHRLVHITQSAHNAALSCLAMQSVLSA